MRFPRNRENCFIAMRDTIGRDGSITSSVPCGAFAQLEDCEDYCGSCEQECREKLGSDANVVFRPALTTFYG
jgi:hypothetical protein